MSDTNQDVPSDTGTTAESSQKTRTSESKVKRAFPKYSIEECRKVADSIKQFNAGKPWAPTDIASALNVGGKTNDFFYLTAASRDYGITLGTRNTEKIELTPLGKALVYPRD